MGYYLDERSSLDFIRALRIGRADASLTVAMPCRPVRTTWRHSPAGPAGSTRPSGDKLLSLMKAAHPHAAAAFEARLPVGLLVGSPSHRARLSPSGLFSSVRLEGTALPEGAFLEVTDGIFVCSAAHALARLANRTDMGQWLLAAMELCGTYAINPSQDGGCTRTRPFSSVGRIEAVIPRYTRVAGGRMACMRSAYILDGSASPRESQAAILFSLPPRHGGYGIRRPELNAPLDLAPRKGAAQCAPKTFIPDLLWREQRVVMEYDSDQEHANADGIARDARRRNELEVHGYVVVTLTNQQLKSVSACDDVARQLASHLQIRQRRRDFSDTWRQRNLALRKSLGLPC